VKRRRYGTGALRRLKDNNIKSLCRASGDLCTLALDAAKKVREEYDAENGEALPDIKTLKELSALIKDLSALVKGLELPEDEGLQSAELSVFFEGGADDYGG